MKLFTLWDTENQQLIKIMEKWLSSVDFSLTNPPRIGAYESVIIDGVPIKVEIDSVLLTKANKNIPTDIQELLKLTNVDKVMLIFGKLIIPENESHDFTVLITD